MDMLVFQGTSEEEFDSLHLPQSEASPMQVPLRIFFVGKVKKSPAISDRGQKGQIKPVLTALICISYFSSWRSCCQ